MFTTSELTNALNFHSVSIRTADFFGDIETDEEKWETMESDVYDLDAFVAFVDGFESPTESTDLDEVIERFEDAFAGTWDSEQAYVESGIEEGLFGEIDTDSLLGRYLDIDALTRDVFISDMTSIPAPEGEVHVFHNC